MKIHLGEDAMRRGVCFVFTLFVLTTACLVVTSAFSKSKQSEKSPIKTWIQRIKKNPNDVQALTGIGEACFGAKRYDISRKCFLRAFRVSPNDALTLYYLGRLLELQNKKTAALKMYAKYQSATGSPFQEKMEERYLLIRREAMKEEMQKLLDNEKAIGAEQMSPQAVAVLPFTVQDANPQIAPLGKGLAEMLITDLSQIKNLSLVERIRVQSLFDEMAMGQTGMVEVSQAAKFGKLLSAGRIVRGDLSLSKKNQVRMEAVYVNAVQNQESKPVTVADAFNNLFRVEKDLAFKVLNKMGIDPTPQERERILKVPTKNLQAFIAYCNGLDLEDKGQFQKAASQYQKAIQLDPNYSMAKQKLRVDQILVRASGGKFKKEAIPASRSERMARPMFDKEILMSDRLRSIQTNIGSNFIMGKDVRKPSQEIDAATPELPGPPDMPDVLP
jgi:tetratricopeptide (TPR) repeat protein